MSKYEIRKRCCILTNEMKYKLVTSKRYTFNQRKHQFLHVYLQTRSPPECFAESTKAYLYHRRIVCLHYIIFKFFSLTYKFLVNLYYSGRSINTVKSGNNNPLLMASHLELQSQPLNLN